MLDVRPDPGSFRDPRGRVYSVNGAIYRTIETGAREDFEYIRGNAEIKSLAADKKILDFNLVQPDVLGGAGANAAYVVEHPRIDCISYPYEWGFPALKSAALLHLEIQLQLLETGIALSDASAYNIQFQGPHPVFIDLLSFRKYREGEIWNGHKQFCEQFLNPLLLRAKCGVAHNQWYRGAQEGISVSDLRMILPWRSKLSPNVLMHVIAQSALQKSAAGKTIKKSDVAGTGLPLVSYRNMLARLRAWIMSLEPHGSGKTVWQDYATDNSYDSDEVMGKNKFIAEFASAVKPGIVWDIGCNTGDYSKAALKNGARYCVGFDFDNGAIEQAYVRALQENLNFLPLVMDCTNPSPSQGWNQSERKGMKERANANALIALAFIHHIAIARNVPLGQVVDWLIELAPQGVIEFVPKNDPMVARLLALREDIFPGYSEDSFLNAVSKKSRIIRQETITRAGRTLVWYDRTQ